MTDHVVEAHQQAQSHHYVMHFPPHPAREHDPHYIDFRHYHKRMRGTARCYTGERIGYADCRDAQFRACPPPVAGGEQPGLELHHSHIEFSLQQGVDLAALEKDYPGVSNPDEVGAWVESAANLRWYCAWHHRGAAGAHTSSHSDFEGSHYVHGLITSGEPDAAHLYRHVHPGGSLLRAVRETHLAGAVQPDRGRAAAVGAGAAAPGSQGPLMALPVGLTTIAVTGTYLNAIGTAQSGSVAFVPTAAVRDPAGLVVLAAVPIVTPLNSDGEFTITLPCTDTRGLSPLGWQYTCTVAVGGAQQTFGCYLPSAFGATVDITALAPVTGTPSPSGVNYLPSASMPPAANPTGGGGFLYCVDGALYWLGPAGSATLIAPP